MELKNGIYSWKSVRSYTGEPVSGTTLENIRAFAAGARQLDERYPVAAEILPRERFQSVMTWLPPQAVALFAPEGERALVNVGFVGQQVALYLESLGLGVCWVGLARLKEPETRPDGLNYAIMLAFGYPNETPQRTREEFKRKPLGEIADREDASLEPARLAPSSINSQPWYFVHGEDGVHLYCSLSGFLRKKALGSMNLMDCGIALGQLYVANSETFRFFAAEKPRQIKGYGYLGSFTL